MKPTPMIKTTRTYKNGREETGFWLPVRNLFGTTFQEDSLPETRQVEFHIWMGECLEDDWREEKGGPPVVTRFVGGVLSLGTTYVHVNALKVEDTDSNKQPDGYSWECPFEAEGGDGDYFAALGQPDKKPVTFEVEGYDGEWAIHAFPFC